MISKDLVAASSKALILSILAEGESYGYAIIQRVKELSEHQLQWTDGMLYPILHRLETEGHIRASWKVADSGRKRKYYRLEEAGQTALNDQKQQWHHVHNTLMKLWQTNRSSI